MGEDLGDAAAVVHGARVPPIKPPTVGRYAPFPTAYATVKHLWQTASHFLSLDNVETSTMLSRAMIKASATSLTELGAGVEDMLCTGCGAILVPGSTAKVRIHHRERDAPANKKRRRGGLKKKGGRRHGGDGMGGGGNAEGTGGKTLRNEVVYTCMRCGTQKREPGVVRQGPVGGGEKAEKKAIKPPVAVKSKAPLPAEPQGLQGKKREAPAAEEEFIPLGGGGHKGGSSGGYGEGGKSKAGEKLPLRPLDSKPRKRKKGGAAEAEKPPKPSSLSLDGLKSIFNAFSQKGTR